MRSLLTSLFGCLILASTCAAQSAWTLIKTPNLAPPKRHLHGMAYDSSRQRTVVFGGWDGENYLADTWEWDGQGWLQVAPTVSPSKRNSQVMAYDSTRRRIVLFGGWAGGYSYFAETWEYDGKTWTQMLPTTSPPGLLQAAMVYDEARQRMVLFGGTTVNGRVGDTWEWDGAEWKQMKPKNAPLRRGRHAMAYDSARRRTVLFGGLTGEGSQADTWEWDGTDWTEINTSTKPTQRSDHAIAYDAGRQRMVIYGGWSDISYLADTWEYDGNDWTKVQEVVAPSMRERHRMVYDTARKRTVLFAGSLGATYYNDTWEYIGPKLSLTADTSIVAIIGGAQKYTLDAGSEHGGRNYWILGSMSGSGPGVDLGGQHFPLNPDFWTEITIAQPNSAILANTRGVLDPAGKAQAAFNIPEIPDPRAVGLVFHHAFLVYDNQDIFHLVSNPVSLLLTAPQDRVIENFKSDSTLDKAASSGTWGGNTVTFGNIGGDGVLGEFDYTNGKALGNNVWEWSTDGGTTIPAAQTLDNATHKVTDGVFNFSTFVLPAGVTINFVGNSPLQLNARGEMSILGRILCNGADFGTNTHTGGLATGEAGGAPGPGGGRGGNGADRGDGVAHKTNFDGQDGQDVQLPAGHAYTAKASTTGGPGSKQVPADGKLTSVKYSIVSGYVSGMLTPGGSGGGNATAGNAGSAFWTGPNTNKLNLERGPAAAPGTALGWDAVKPTNANSLEHHQVGGSGGGGGGSQPLYALAPGSSSDPVFHTGRAGAGGGGAVAIRSGSNLTVGPLALIQARGGNAGKVTEAFTNKAPCPGGGGSGGTIFFQVDGNTDMQGSVEATAGKGGNITGNPLGEDYATVNAGDGGDGIIRMETVGTLGKARLGTTLPAAKDTDVQPLTDKDQYVGMRSVWYEVNLTNPPKFVRYEVHAKVDGNPVVFSDDNQKGPLAARGSAPVIFFAQGAKVRKNASNEIEPIPNMITPWRRFVGPFVTGQSMAGDGATGYRFTLILDRSLGKTVEIQFVSVFYTL